MKKLIHLLVFLLAMAGALVGQERASKLHLSGYVKNLQSLYFFNDAYPDLRTFELVDTFLQDNFFHHRLNAEWEWSDNFSLKGGLRTRLFFGDLVRASPDYGAQIDQGSNDWVDLSVLWIEGNNFVGHSVLDRFYGEYAKDNWELRVGRQRVNWGISTIWNPNDIFNAYAFTDFDYEERPGADVVRVRYFTGFAGSVELAMRGADQLRNTTLAGRWLFNVNQYDLQLIAGYTQSNWVFGGGWAGNLKDAGFKGEASWFYQPEDASHSLAITTNVDYAFENALYLNAGVLYNSNGSTEGSILNLFTFELSARNLYPYRWATFTQVAYPISPLLNAGLAVIYSPVKSHALFANPTLTLSVANNWSLDLVGQVVFNREKERYTSPLQAAFIRLKYSY